MRNLTDTTERADTSAPLTAPGITLRANSGSPVVDSVPTMAGASDPGGFYGWRIVGFSTVVVALTAPGQTAAVSAFIDPMISGLGVSRTQLSTSYLIGTLTGAAAMPWIGRALDRYGVRRTMTTVAAAFGAVLIAMSLATNLISVGAGFIGVRMLGQGALGLTATTATALWFTRRRGLALGLVSAVGACGFSLAPLALERLIFDHGWRLMWATEGLLFWAVVLPIALFGMRDRPSDLGQRPDGEPHPSDGSQPADQSWGLTRAQAARTRFFWVVTAGVAASGLLSTQSPSTRSASWGNTGSARPRQRTHRLHPRPGHGHQRRIHSVRPGAVRDGPRRHRQLQPCIAGHWRHTHSCRRGCLEDPATRDTGFCEPTNPDNRNNRHNRRFTVKARIHPDHCRSTAAPTTPASVTR